MVKNPPSEHSAPEGPAAETAGRLSLPGIVQQDPEKRYRLKGAFSQKSTAVPAWPPGAPIGEPLTECF